MWPKKDLWVPCPCASFSIDPSKERRQDRILLFNWHLLPPRITSLTPFQPCWLSWYLQAPCSFISQQPHSLASLPTINYSACRLSSPLEAHPFPSTGRAPPSDLRALIHTGHLIVASYSSFHGLQQDLLPDFNNPTQHGPDMWEFIEGHDVGFPFICRE